MGFQGLEFKLKQTQIVSSEKSKQVPCKLGYPFIDEEAMGL